MTVTSCDFPCFIGELGGRLGDGIGWVATRTKMRTEVASNQSSQMPFLEDARKGWPDKPCHVIIGV